MLRKINENDQYQMISFIYGILRKKAKEQTKTYQNKSLKSECKIKLPEVKRRELGEDEQQRRRLNGLRWKVSY